MDMGTVKRLDGRSHFTFLEAALLFSLFFAPIAFGCVYPWAEMGLCALLFFTFAVYPQALFEIRNLPYPFIAGISFLFLLAQQYQQNANLNSKSQTSKYRLHRLRYYSRASTCRTA